MFCNLLEKSAMQDLYLVALATLYILFCCCVVVVVVMLCHASAHAVWIFVLFILEYMGSLCCRWVCLECCSSAGWSWCVMLCDTRNTRILTSPSVQPWWCGLWMWSIIVVLFVYMVFVYFVHLSACLPVCFLYIFVFTTYLVDSS